MSVHHPNSLLGSCVLEMLVRLHGKFYVSTHLTSLVL